MGGRGASSGLSERGNPYGSQYHTILEHENYMIVRMGDKENTFYLFGGKDEGSQDLI